MNIIKRFNPVLLLIIFSILVFIIRKYFFPEYSDAALVNSLKDNLSALGPLGFLLILVIYAISSFLFIPILIPLNIACGALYGPMTGAVLALAGITLGSTATTISVRHVFRGMGKVVMRHQESKRILNQLTRYGDVVVVIIRLAFIVPYLLQNIILALTNITIGRLALLTLLGAIPGALSYSFIGAGIVNLEDTNQYGLFILIPIVLLYCVNSLIQYLQKKYGISNESD